MTEPFDLRRINVDEPTNDVRPIPTDEWRATVDDGGWVTDSYARAAATKGCEIVWRGDREKLRWVGGVKSSRSKGGINCYGKKIIINFAH